MITNLGTNPKASEVVSKVNELIDDSNAGGSGGTTSITGTVTKTIGTSGDFATPVAALNWVRSQTFARGAKVILQVLNSLTTSFDLLDDDMSHVMIRGGSVSAIQVQVPPNSVGVPALVNAYRSNICIDGSWEAIGPSAADTVLSFSIGDSNVTLGQTSLSPTLSAKGFCAICASYFGAKTTSGGVYWEGNTSYAHGKAPIVTAFSGGEVNIYALVVDKEVGGIAGAMKGSKIVIGNLSQVDWATRPIGVIMSGVDSEINIKTSSYIRAEQISDVTNCKCSLTASNTIYVTGTTTNDPAISVIGPSDLYLYSSLNLVTSLKGSNFLRASSGARVYMGQLPSIDVTWGTADPSGILFMDLDDAIVYIDYVSNLTQSEIDTAYMSFGGQYGKTPNASIVGHHGKMDVSVTSGDTVFVRDWASVLTLTSSSDISGLTLDCSNYMNVIAHMSGLRLLVKTLSGYYINGITVFGYTTANDSFPTYLRPYESIELVFNGTSFELASRIRENENGKLIIYGDRTFLPSDNGIPVIIDSETDTILTVPTASNFEEGAQIPVIRYGVGEVEFTNALGVILQSPSMKRRITNTFNRVTLTLVNKLSNIWVLDGDLKV